MSQCVLWLFYWSYCFFPNDLHLSEHKSFASRWSEREQSIRRWIMISELMCTRWWMCCNFSYRQAINMRRIVFHRCVGYSFGFVFKLRTKHDIFHLTAEHLDPIENLSEMSVNCVPQLLFINSVWNSNFELIWYIRSLIHSFYFHICFFFHNCIGFSASRESFRFSSRLFIIVSLMYGLNMIEEFKKKLFHKKI